MNRRFARFVSIMLTLVMVIQGSCLAQAASVPQNQSGQPEYQFFEDAQLGSAEQGKDIFWFGSKNMTVSEKSSSCYIMKIKRAGKADTEASVTVKFMDMAAEYGRNYEVFEYGTGNKPVVDPAHTSVRDMFINNADNVEEYSEPSQEEISNLLAESGGITVLDAKGNPVSEVGINTESGTESSGASVPEGDSGTAEVALQEENPAGVAESEASPDGEISDEEAAQLNEELNENMDRQGLVTGDYTGLINEQLPGAELKLTFKPGETEKYVAVKPIYSKEAEGDSIVSVILKDPTGKMAVLEDGMTSYLTIKDEDKQKAPVLSIEKTKYLAEDDAVSITVTRKGGLNKMAVAEFSTEEITGKMGEDFQGYKAKVIFSMGMTSRTIEVKVNHLSDETLSFRAKLSAAEGCEIGNPEAVVNITPAFKYEEKKAAEKAELQKEEEKKAQQESEEATEKSGSDSEADEVSTPQEEAYNADTEASDGITDDADIEGEEAYTEGEVTSFGSGEADTKAIYGKSGRFTAPSAGSTDIFTSPEYMSIGQKKLMGVELSTDWTDDLIETINSLVESTQKDINYRYKLSPDNAVSTGGTMLKPDNGDFALEYPNYESQGFIFKMQDYLFDGVSYEIKSTFADITSINSRATPDVQTFFESKEGKVFASSIFNDSKEFYFGRESGNDEVVVHLHSMGALFERSYRTKTTFKYCRPIYRQFKFTLEDADPLDFIGVGKAEAKTYVSAQLNDGAKSATAGIGESITVSAPSNQKPYTRLAAVQLIGRNGKVLYTEENTTNTRSITVNMSHYVLKHLGTADTEFKQNGEKFVGQITVKPVFEYIDSEVTVNPGKQGNFDYSALDPDGISALSGLDPDRDNRVTLHLGDRLICKPVTGDIYEGLYVADGVRYERRDAEGKLIKNGSGQIDCDSEGKVEFTITEENISLTPAFKKVGNVVLVKVNKKDVDSGKYDTTKGLFTAKIQEQDSDSYYYVMSKVNVSAGNLVTMWAEPTDKSQVCRWEMAGDSRTFTGDTFYFESKNNPEENIITLSLEDGQNYDLYGYIYHADKNLAINGISGEPVIPSATASVYCGGKMDQTSALNEDCGRFGLYDVKATPYTYVRVLVLDNGNFCFKDVKLGVPGNVNLGVVTSAVNTPDAACFTGVYCYQNGMLRTNSETLHMDGKALKLVVTAHDGNKYTLDGEEYTEHVTGVTFYVLDGTTHEIKSTYEGKKVQGDDSAWSMEIPKFSPDNATDYGAGDVFYVSMTTDRMQSAVKDDDDNSSDALKKTRYAMLSTGYEIIRDLNYTPQKIHLDSLSSAADLGISGLSLSDDSDKNKKKNFVSLPFVGAIDNICSVMGFVTGSSGYNNSWIDGYQQKSNPEFGDDLEEESPYKTAYIDKEGLNADDTSAADKSKVQVKITVNFLILPNNAYRVQIGVTAITGNSAWVSSSASDPSKVAWYGQKTNTSQNAAGSGGSKSKSLYNSFSTQNGSPRMCVSVTLGFYIDFGIISETDIETNENDDISKAVFLGAGGFLAAAGSVEFQWSAMAGPIPVFFGVIGTASFSGFVGGEKDHTKVLGYTEMTEDDENVMDVNKMELDTQIVSSLSIKGYGGVGIADVIGVRVIVGLIFDFTCSPLLAEMYHTSDEWGMELTLTMGGKIDYIISSYSFDGFSFPLKAWGFADYFKQLKRNGKLVDYISKEYGEKKDSLSEEQQSKVEGYMNTLKNGIDSGADKDTLVRDFNEAVDYVYNKIGLISKTEYNSLYIKAFYDVWLNDEEEEGQLKETLISHTDSEWTANDEAYLMGGFDISETRSIVQNGYTTPSPKLMNMGGGNMLSVYLVDKSEAGQVTKPQLVYSIYNSASDSWSEPAVLQNDGFIDYTPNLCDAGDDIIISWASATKSIEECGNDTTRLMDSMDIYTVRMNKTTGETGGITRLTNDDYMDYKPSMIYDDESGDLIVYYLKNDGTSKSAMEYAANESVVCYRLYDSDENRWAVEWYHNEYEDFSEDQLREYGELYGGQRFLSSVVADSSGENLPIKDLTACEGYNGLAIISYVVDMDGNPETDSDQDMFLRVYDFRDHKTYNPIRLTNDSVSQSAPQLIRNNKVYEITDEEGTVVDTKNGTTYLFWLQDLNQVAYFDVSALIRNGIDDEGKIADGYIERVYKVDTAFDDGSVDYDGESSVQSYYALTDEKDNLYVVWSQPCKSSDENANEDVNKPAPLEIFAAAMIDDQDAGEHGSTAVWSKPNKLTESEMCNDGVVGAVSDDGQLYLMYNQYVTTYNGNTGGNPYDIGSKNLMNSVFKPVGTITATEFTFSDEHPCPGDTIEVTAKVENDGLTSAMGYTCNFYESRNGEKGKLLATFDRSRKLIANDYQYYTFDWTVPEDFEKVRIMCEGRELGYEYTEPSYSDSLNKTALYEIKVNSIEQKGDKFEANYTVTNTGNVTDKNHKVNIEFAALYGRYDTFYGLDSPILAEISLGGLEPKQSEEFTTYLNLPASALDYCGYDEIRFKVVDESGTEFSPTVSEFIVLKNPIKPVLTAEKNTIEVNEKTRVNAASDSKYYAKRGKIIYSSSDLSVAKVDENGTVTGVGGGTAVIEAQFTPYGVSAQTEITVKGEPADIGKRNVRNKTENNQVQNPDEDIKEAGGKLKFTDVPEGSYYYDSVVWAVDEKITGGTSETTFSPSAPCTRAQMAMFLWRAAGQPEPEGTECVFKDVKDDDYFRKAVMWLTEQKITSGTTKETFSPKDECTRAQMAVFLHRFSGSAAPEKEKNPFEDVKKGSYYYDSVLWVYEKEITKGLTETTFGPNEICTRAQMVTFLDRCMKVKKAEEEAEAAAEAKALEAAELNNNTK